MLDIYQVLFVRKIDQWSVDSSNARNWYINKWTLVIQLIKPLSNWLEQAVKCPLTPVLAASNNHQFFYVVRSVFLSNVGHAHVSDKHYMPRLKMKNMCLGKNDSNIQNKQIFNKKINWMEIDFSHVRKLSSK